MSLIWHMVNRSLPIFCSEFGPGLDHPPYLSDDQSSASSNTTEKHYSGLVIKTLPEELSSSRTGPHQGDRRLQSVRHGASHHLTATMHIPSPSPPGSASRIPGWTGG